jgi:hypothetical protein
MTSLGLPFRRWSAQERTREQKGPVRRTHQNDWHLRAAPQMLGFVFDAGFRRLVPGATFYQALSHDFVLKVRRQTDLASCDSKMQTFP